MVHYALEAAERVAGRASTAKSSTCARCGRSTARRCCRPCARRASAWSPTRTTGSAATGRRSRRSSPRRRSTTSTGRSPGSPGRTCRRCPTTMRSRTGSCSARPRSRTRSGAGRVLMAPSPAGPRGDRGAAAGGAGPLRGAARVGHDLRHPDARRPGAKAHDWFAFVKPASQHVGFYLLPMHTWPVLRSRCPPACESG